MARYRRRRRYRRKRKSTTAVAYKALKLAKAVSSRSEVKYIDNITTVTDVDSDGQGAINLLSIPQGLEDTDRIGDSIFVNSINIRCCFRRNQSVCDFMRVIAIQDYNNEFADPIDILVETGFTNSFLSHYIKDTRMKYKVLLDKTINISANLRESAYYSFYLKPKTKIQYLATGTTPIKNNIKFFLISDVQSVANTKPVFQGWWRVNYYDQ